MGALGCLCCFRYQVLDQSLQLLLSLANRLLLPHDGDQLLFRVIGCREDDPGPRPVPHATDVGATTADEELVVLRFGVELGGEVVDLLKKGGEQQEFVMHHASIQSQRAH